MAIGILARVLSTLIKKHGLVRGVKKAKGLGFRNSDIKDAVSSIGAKRRPKLDFSTRKKFRKMDKAFGDDKRSTPRFREEAGGDYKRLPRKFQEPQDRWAKEYDELAMEEAYFKNRMGEF